MYEAHFGLTRLPFSLSPDTGLFVNLNDHRACFALILHALYSGEGFLKVVGEVGTGKTILCRKLLRHLERSGEHSAHTVYIPNPMLSPIGLYRAVGKELGLDVSQQQDNDALLSHITDRILDLAKTQRSVVIVVDEAQSLPAETLEALRLITNLETEDTKLVQIILFGQTELDELLSQDRFRQLRQRITFSHYLQPLNEAEVQQYIDYRLQQTGYNGPALFATKATARLAKTSRGVPRMINVLAHKSLLAAYAERAPQVLPKHIKQAAKDSQEPSPNRHYRWLVGVAAALFASALAWRLM